MVPPASGELDQVLPGHQLLADAVLRDGDGIVAAVQIVAVT